MGTSELSDGKYEEFVTLKEDTLIIVLQILSPGNLDIVEPYTGSYLVEVSIVTAHCHDQIQDDIKNFADQLKPYPLC